jgi:putative transposon-encoded protein
MKFTLAFVALALTATSAAALTTIMPFGNGYIVNTPMQPPSTVMPFGNGAIINTPGQAPTTVMPFGNGYIVNEPMRPLRPLQMPGLLDD